MIEIKYGEDYVLESLSTRKITISKLHPDWNWMSSMIGEKIEVYNALFEYECGSEFYCYYTTKNGLKYIADKYGIHQDTIGYFIPTDCVATREEKLERILK